METRPQRLGAAGFLGDRNPQLRLVCAIAMWSSVFPDSMVQEVLAERKNMDPWTASIWTANEVWIVWKVRWQEGQR